MPTYDYICDACGHEFEAFESITSDSQTICPTCKEAKLRRKIGPGAAVIFKGSGFYQTDYRSESYKKAAKADTPEGSKSEGSKSDTSKSDTPKSDTPKSDAPKIDTSKPSSGTSSSSSSSNGTT